ncbi:hypothetical protein NG799_16660 [Laspinema sp. D1]|uniref:Uncharacterized protein n=1 Tax=Laspinema palackyanum D2a TaxID=2953684 RepID=A0ABT2MT69_9CYAN|nr:hypothetical protein [Laspinema sp. D2b]MCT7967945.1 hypothetical protein [Laspinema sp. D2a]
MHPDTDASGQTLPEAFYFLRVTGDRIPHRFNWGVTPPGGAVHLPCWEKICINELT